MIKARRNALKCMQLKGIVPLHQILDNKISVAYKEEILAANMSYQLVPPDNHHQHISERAIQTWKSHFIGVLAGIAATFPLHLWCQIIPQAERQIILVSQTNLNPNISEYTYVYGQNDENATPFVPIGMESLVHDKPNKIKTFAEHCRKGYVLGTPFEHYCAWHFWMLNTIATRVSTTALHKHKYISNPNITPPTPLFMQQAIWPQH